MIIDLGLKGKRYETLCLGKFVYRYNLSAGMKNGANEKRSSITGKETKLRVYFNLSSIEMNCQVCEGKHLHSIFWKLSSKTSTIGKRTQIGVGEILPENLTACIFDQNI
jgi:hypothetical protein